jgi:hypothetical protein
VAVVLAGSFVLRWWFFTLRRKFNNNYQGMSLRSFFSCVFFSVMYFIFIGEFRLFVPVCYGDMVAAELVMV